MSGSYTDRVPPTPLQPGTTFAGYVIETHLGAGGMGDVYRVQHTELHKSFAMKILPATYTEDPMFAARFRREMETVSRLDHPNIVTAANGGSVDGRIWFTMTYVPGTDAQHALSARPGGLPTGQVVHIVEKTGAALDYAHRKGILHRDIKPANILLAPPGDDDDERVYLTDFGIAKAIDDMRPITTTPQGPMTLDFASPEQIRGDPLDGRSDVYSLGATMFTLLTGRVPFPAATIPAKMLKHLDEPPPRPTAVNAALPPGFDDVVRRAMAKNPQDRYPTCSALAAAARQHLPAQQTGSAQRTAPTTIEPPGAVRTLPAPAPAVAPRSWNRRRRTAAMVAAIVIVAISAAAIWWSSTPGRPTNGDSTLVGASESSRPAGSLTSTPGNRVNTTVISPDSATAEAVGPTGSTATDGPGGVQPLADLLSPAPVRKPGTVGGTAVASGAAYSMQPKGCPRGIQQITVELNQAYDRIEGSIQLDDGSPPSTNTRFVAAADGEVLTDEVLRPTLGASFDLPVRDKQTLLITLESLGQGSCDSGDYLVFLTSALAYPRQP